MTTTTVRSTLPFAGRIVAVTGAAGGVGSATTTAFVAAGATVVGIEPTEGPRTPGVTWEPCDVTDDTAVATAFARIRDVHGWLDVLVNNAAISTRGTVETATDEDWLRVFDVNVFAVARTSRHALPLLRVSDAASIVNVASVNAVAGTPLRAVYSASKGAVAALTRAMAADLLEEGIRVNALHPGPVLTAATGRHDSDRDAAIRHMMAAQPLGHMIGVEEIADAILYLARPGNRSLTGAELVYDGSHTEVVNVGTV